MIKSSKKASLIAVLISAVAFAVYIICDWNLSLSGFWDDIPSLIGSVLAFSLIVINNSSKKKSEDNSQSKSEDDSLIDD